jgi:hypothetical protein
MTRYAENTSVPSERSKAEIERLLARYGATDFMSGWDQRRAVVGFAMAHRRVQFVLTMPDRTSAEFTRTSARKRVRSTTQAEAAYEQAVRQRWRALALVIKAKLEAVETGIATFEEEFLAHILLPNGRTVGEFMLPQIDIAYTRGTMPPLLPMPAKADR